MKSVLRRARSLLRLRLLLMQLALATLVSGLFLLWLHVPESSVFDVSLSFLFAVVIATVALCGECFVLLQTCPVSYSDGRKRMQLGALSLLVAAGTWFALSVLLGRWSASDSLLAGYLNSRAPAPLRNFLSFWHLYNWLEDTWNVLRWIGAGLLLAPVLALILALRRAAAVRRLSLSLAYWIVFILSALVGSSVTHTLLAWTPGHGLAVETVSLVIRLSAVVFVDLVLACFVFTTAIAIVLRSDEEAEAQPAYSTPVGTPEPSQLRT